MIARQTCQGTLRLCQPPFRVGECAVGILPTRLNFSHLAARPEEGGSRRQASQLAQLIEVLARNLAFRIELRELGAHGPDLLPTRRKACESLSSRLPAPALIALHHG